MSILYNSKLRLFMLFMFMIMAWFGQFLRFLIYNIVLSNTQSNDKSSFLFFFQMIYLLSYSFFEIPLSFYFYKSNWKNSFLNTNLLLIGIVIIGLIFDRHFIYFYFLSVILAFYNSSMFVLISYYYTNIFQEKFIIFLGINFSLGLIGGLGFPFSYFIDFQTISTNILMAIVILIPALWSFVWYFIPSAKENNLNLDNYKYLPLTFGKILKDYNSIFIFVSGFIQGVLSFFIYLQQSRFTTKSKSISYFNVSINFANVSAVTIGVLIGVLLLRSIQNKTNFWQLFKRQYVIILALQMTFFVLSIRLKIVGQEQSSFLAGLICNMFFSSLLMYPFWVGYIFYKKYVVIWFAYYSSFSVVGSALGTLIINSFPNFNENELMVCIILGFNIFVWSLIKEKVFIFTEEL